MKTTQQHVDRAKHTCNDGKGPRFGRLTAGCARCDELASGAKPREGWGAQRRQAEAAWRRDLYAHDCRARGCGPVCTAFDW